MPVAGLLWKTYSVSTLAPASRITKIPTTWSMPFSHSESIKSTKMKQKHHLPNRIFSQICARVQTVCMGAPIGERLWEDIGTWAMWWWNPMRNQLSQTAGLQPGKLIPTLKPAAKKTIQLDEQQKMKKLLLLGSICNRTVPTQQNFHLPSQVALDSPIQRSHSPSNVNSQADGDPKHVSETNTMWDSTQTWIKSACKSMDTTTVCIGTLLKTLQCIGAPTNLDRFLKHWGFTRKWHSIWNVKCTKLGRNGQRR